MKKSLLLLFALFVVLSAGAQTKVVDAAGEPLIGTAVLDHNGTPICIVDKDGIMPEVAAESYPLTLRCLGFESVAVESPVAKIVMYEKSYELGEVVIKPGERPACRVVCYIRETSGMMNGVDTVRITSQYMVDYMFQADPKAKGVPTWKSPRELCGQMEQFSSSGKELGKRDCDFLKWYDIVSDMSYEDASFPKELHGRTSGSYSIKSKKYDDDVYTFNLTPSKYSVFVDILADREGHKWTPGIFKILAATLDIYEMWGKKTYNYSADEKYNLHNLVARTYSMKILGRGKLFHAVFGGNSPVDMTSYVEIFPVEISYLTREEAKALKKDKDATYPMTIPSAAK